MSFNVAVIGVGRMGRHHARTLANKPDANLVAVVDANLDAAEEVAAQRDCKAFANPTDVVDLVDAVIVATPTIAHLDCARPFVEAGKHVLIEKPFCEDPKQGQELIDLAKKTGSVLQVGHTERFNPASVALRKYNIQPKFIEAHRISPYTFRSADVGVVLDMMIHDIDLVLGYAQSEVVEVDGIGVNVIAQTEDICNARLRFESGCVANITASRLAIKTERKMRIFSEEHYLSIDYGKQCGLVVEKAKNLDLIQMARDMDVDDIAQLAQECDYKDLLTVEELHPDENMADPLTLQAEDFRQCVEEGKAPYCSAENGLQAVIVAQKIVEAIDQHAWDGTATGRAGFDILSKE
ncbi:MAG: Gfo/Idh/MocA family oxidoreductase [Phycisphaerales bacterium]|jgi:predicted dehydrogenase|nr:Gfo/Idh/MocA family oxidoreductase [Phycisphaerales bacterium]MBT7170824.1 Gfo/Idh/MocA family oxidoreductase [Phycisphaerales bacterium]